MSKKEENIKANCCQSSAKEEPLCKADYETILSEELVAALGCTEPIAIALCTAKAGDLLREVLGQKDITDSLDRVELSLSSNVIKNAHSVYVPNSGNKKGIPFAAALGLLAGDADRGLEVLEAVDEQGRQRAEQFLAQGKLTSSVAEGVDCLYVSCRLLAGDHEVTATIAGDHDKFTFLERDGKVILDLQQSSPEAEKKLQQLKTRLNFPDIWQAQADGLVEDSPVIQDLLDRQISCNAAIAETGLNEAWGQEVGRNILTHKSSDEDELIAAAAAGSDARMAGCAQPVVINSGSGNQGMTLSLPLICEAKQNGQSREELRRALFVANTTAIYLKASIGKLSAYCGAVSAAAACAAGLACLRGFSRQVAENTLINALSISSGLVCDGATGSCAAKIAVSLRSAFLALQMAEKGQVFPPGEGLGGSSLEVCIENVGRMARNMVTTDLEIMNIIIEDK